VTAGGAAVDVACEDFWLGMKVTSRGSRKVKSRCVSGGMDLLAFGGGLHGSAAARAKTSADGRTPAASGEAADDGAKSCATTDHSA